MSEAEPAPPPMHHDLYFMIPDAAARQVMLLPAAEGWTLPHATGQDADPWDPAALAAHIRAQWGASVTELRIADGQLDREVTRQAVFTYALENHDPAWTPPPGARLVDRAALAGLAVEPAAAREAISTWLDEEASGAFPAQRPPWARRGWLARAGAWAAAQMEARGQPLTGPLTQVKTWSISCLLRAETTGGTVYFKAAPTLPLFTNEPAVVATLARFFPGRVPDPLAVEPDERWMLMADFGGPQLDEADLPAWEATVAAAADLHQASMPHTETLLAAGCLDRRLATLPAAIEWLVAATAAHPRISAEHKAGLAAAVPRLQTLCAELAGYGIPETLVHGDLHSGNVAVPGGAPLFFDWSDACIAHPFLDLATLLDPEWLESMAAHRAALLARYLAAWTDYAPLPRLHAAADVGVVLGRVHQAISYQHIVLSGEPTARWELDGGWGFWVRQILAGLAALPDDRR